MTYVNLTTVNDMYDAHFLGQALEEEGILYIAANESSATTMPYLRQGIQIRVREEDFERAKAIADSYNKTK